MVGDLEGVSRVGNVSIWSWCQFRDALALQKGCATPFRN
jgi:hypothetical protein